MSVKSIMTSEIVCVDMDDSLGFIRGLFASHQFHHLLVVEHGKLVGVISDRDLFMAISPNVGTVAANKRDEATLYKRAHQIMTRRPLTISEDATLYEAVDIFLAEGISCLPIIDNQLKPMGIITWRDILKVISERYHRKVGDIPPSADESNNPGQNI
jgi:acetoin utilization protein AcuB